MNQKDPDKLSFHLPFPRWNRNYGNRRLSSRQADAAKVRDGWIVLKKAG